MSFRIGRVCLLLACSVEPAKGAEHCAPEPPPAVPRSSKSARPRVGLELGLERANFATERYVGSFVGIVPAARLGGQAWDVSLDVPLYHLVKNGLGVSGPGDPFVRGRVRLWRPRSESMALGVGLGLSAPLGDADLGLGMGHFMIHPSVWLGSTGKQVRTEWSFGYGRVLGDGEHGEPTGPLVSPMSASELSAGGALVWSALRSFDLLASALTAVPVAAPGGEPRATAGFGARLRLGALRLSLAASFPVVGDPFTDKLELSIGYSF